MFGRGKMSATENRDPYYAAREYMIEEQLRRRGVVRHSVLEAMREIPRHLFVAHSYAQHAYADEALPSQEGQTISQPFMVGLMTQELDVKPGQRILEIGTGTGYQTALLAYLAGTEGLVCTIERVESLSQSARRRLDAMGFHNIHYFTGDGSMGWPQHLPWNGPRGPEGQPLFERIMVTAGAPDTPAPLLHQLADEGVMIVPVGSSQDQSLLRIVRHGDVLERVPVLGCRFVPLVGEYGWNAPGQN